MCIVYVDWGALNQVTIEWIQKKSQIDVITINTNYINYATATKITAQIID